VHSKRSLTPQSLPSHLTGASIERQHPRSQTYTSDFAVALLTDVDAWFGATVDRYSFDVGLLHSFLHAGLSRRPNLDHSSDPLPTAESSTS